MVDRAPVAKHGAIDGAASPGGWFAKSSDLHVGSIMPEEISCVLMVQLMGGPMDGDKVALLPNGSSAPPHAFNYLTTNQQGAAWLVYEAREPQLEWPVGKNTTFFDYIGTYAFNRRERL